MGVALARLQADRHEFPVEVDSAGTLGIVGAPAHPRAVAACWELGLDLSDHRSKALDAELLAWADTVLVMELQHATIARSIRPHLGEEAVIVLGALGGLGDIADPVNSWLMRSFRNARDQIDRCLDLWFQRQKALRAAAPAKTWSSGEPHQP